ncbi:MAG: fumarylacetoacetate hydrolase, partial [Rhodospirillaceae bacterium]|nr:fumarylacetoacetate hydrolase [Rhodospirillaceae bacterium]
MKLAYFDDFKLGVVKGDGLVDVSNIVDDIPHTNSGNLMIGLIEAFDKYR